MRRVPKRSLPVWRVGGGAPLPVVGARVQLLGQDYTDEELRRQALRVRGGPPTASELREWREVRAAESQGTVRRVNEDAGTARVELDSGWKATCCWGELKPIVEPHEPDAFEDADEDWLDLLEDEEN